MNDLNVRESWIVLEPARSEERAPSHDGEYCAVYYCPDSPELNWIIESNAGVVAAGVWDDASALIDARVDQEDDAIFWADCLEAIRRPADGDLPGIALESKPGIEARALMVKAGWIRA